MPKSFNLTQDPLLLSAYKHQLSTDFLEKLGVKDKESIEDNGRILVESYSAGFRAQISSENREAGLNQQMG